MDWRVVHGQMNDDLASLLARKQMQQNFMMRIAADERDRADTSRRHGLDTQRLRLDEDVRRQNAESLKQSRESLTRDRENQDRTRREGRHQNTVKLLPKGAILKRGDAVLKDAEEFGTSPLFKPHGADDHGAEEHFEFGGTQDANEAAATLEQRAKEAELRAELAAGRISVQQAQLELARLRDEFNRSKPGSIQYFNKQDGTMGAFQTMPDGSTREVPLPEGFAGTGNPQKTPEQIYEESRARGAGGVQGKTDAKPPTAWDTIFGAAKQNNPWAKPVEKPNFLETPSATTAQPAATPQVGQTITRNGKTYVIVRIENGDAVLREK
jgi:hypothetical protein